MNDQAMKTLALLLEECGNVTIRRREADGMPSAAVCIEFRGPQNTMQRVEVMEETYLTVERGTATERAIARALFRIEGDR